MREGGRPVNQKFIVGAVRAFPSLRLDELFYLTPKDEDALSPVKDDVIEEKGDKETELAIASW